jgi:hypothetical protein
MVQMYIDRIVLFFGIVFRKWNGVRVMPGAALDIAKTIHDVPWDYRHGRAR